jgi:hypothetical protein
MGTVTFNCIKCGTTKTRYASEVTNGRGKYCSKECQYTYTGTAPYNCPVCSKEFKLIGSRKKRGWLHCSQECRDKTVEAKKFSKEQLQENVYFWRMKVKYNLSREEWQALFDKFEGRCHICKQFETEMHMGKVRRLDVDHCHKTGKVRGLLCTKHNKLLGCAQDDIQTLKAAIEYLEAACLKNT